MVRENVVVLIFQISSNLIFNHFRKYINVCKYTILASPFDSPDVQAKLLADPSTKEFMKDPEFIEILKNIKSNPDMLGM